MYFVKSKVSSAIKWAAICEEVLIRQKQNNRQALDLILLFFSTFSSSIILFY
jgi:hypothetical protein